MSIPDDPRSYDYSHPERECDIVMKGGITSGVVYPHAVCELAQTYRLVNVGGGPAVVVFFLSPLAPRPDLGHVDTEVAELAGSPS